MVYFSFVRCLHVINAFHHTGNTRWGTNNSNGTFRIKYLETKVRTLRYYTLNLLSLKKGESTSKWVLICTFNAERKIVIDPD